MSQILQKPYIFNQYNTFTFRFSDDIWILSLILLLNGERTLDL